MDIVTLRRLYPTTSNAEIGKIIGISASYVGRMAFTLGLKKDPKYLSAVNRNNGRNGLLKMYGRN